MSDIVLSASVRQNLLSLQSTADLLATTQNRLATGKKVNTALDNPTNYFTAAALDNRANDINSLLDGIGNGVQVLQAANTGLTSLQKLVDTAKSVANQVLQTTVGYSQKSTVNTQPIAGATALNLLGTGGGLVNAVLTGTTAITPIDLTGTPAASGSTTAANVYTGNEFGNGDSLVVGSTTVAFDGTTDGTTPIAGSNYTAQEAVDKINHDLQASATASDHTITASYDSVNDKIVLTNSATGTASNFTVDASGSAGADGGFGSTAVTTTNGAAAAPLPDLTFQVNGQTVTLAGGASYDGTAIAAAINTQVGSAANVTASYTSGTLAIDSTGTAGAADAVTVGSFSTGDVSQLGYAAGPSATANGAATSGSLSGKTLTIAATGGGTPVNITFGTGAGQVSTLNDLNAALSVNNLQATISSAGVISITTTSDAASATIGAIGGSSSLAGSPFAGAAGATPVLDPVSQATRAGLIDQYNNIIKQIDTTAADSSFNGINLLNGDTLKLVFNETGKSVLTITGTNTNAAGLGLSALTAGTDFLDNSSANTVISNLDKASSMLRTQASTLGSNLSIVQIRQDFSKNMINVLQTGSSNLTLADTNEEAANSQALSTRQSIAVSALALANQSQQSVLQLLR